MRVGKELPSSCKFAGQPEGPIEDDARLALGFTFLAAGEESDERHRERCAKTYDYANAHADQVCRLRESDREAHPSAMRLEGSKTREN